MDQANPAASPLIGRELETQVLADLLDRVRARGGSLVVTGEPGVGKSALLRQASAHARRGGLSVLTVAGVPSESLLPFAGLHQLLLPVLGRIGELAAPQRDALQSAFGVTDTEADVFLTALAALNLLAGSAARAPVLAIVEDAHWLDRPTCDVLAFVARRLEFEPILMVVAIRDGFATSFDDAGLPALHLEALTPPAGARAAARGGGGQSARAHGTSCRLPAARPGRGAAPVAAAHHAPGTGLRGTGV